MTEVQFAEVTVRVAIEVTENMTNAERIKAINREMADMEMLEDIEVFGQTSNATVLHETETMREAAERRTAQAEAEIMKKKEDQYARHVDEHGYF